MSFELAMSCCARAQKGRRVQEDWTGIGLGLDWDTDNFAGGGSFAQEAERNQGAASRDLFVGKREG